MDETIELASGFKIEDYRRIRKALDNLELSPEWEQVLNAFRRRIRERFLHPINELAKKDKRGNETMRPGFAILTLDCLLIDTIQSFREGRLQDPCLTPSQSFKDFFAMGRFPEFTRRDVTSFFDQVRNALFHNGETRGKWKIRKDTTCILSKMRGDRIINRTLFHSRIILEFRYLCRDLRSSNSEHRRLFLQRMDALCDMTPPFYRYFAYGSNLVNEELRRDAPDAAFEGKAFLPAYRVEFTKHALSRNGDAASIREDATRVVWGVIYRISKESKENLRKRESGYKMLPEIPVYMSVSGKRVKAFTFVGEEACSKKCGPSKEYQNLVLRGAKSHELPEEYVAWIASHTAH